MSAAAADLELDDHVDTLNLDDDAGDGNEAEDRGDVVDPDAVAEAAAATAAAAAPAAAAPATPAKGAAAATPEPAAGEEADAEGEAGGKRGQMIPLSRFNEVLAERNSLRQAVSLAAGAPAQAPAVAAPPAAPEFDLDAKEAAYTKALVDGDDEAALKVRKEINTHIRQESVREAADLIRAENATNAFKAVGQEMRETYPDLDEKSTTANSDAIEYVVWKRDQLIQQGKPLHTALREAAAAAAKTFNLSDTRQAAAPAASPTPAAAPGVDPRKATQLARNARAAAAQPAAPTGVGDRSAVPARVGDVKDMTDDEYSRLPLAEKKKLRGD